MKIKSKTGLFIMLEAQLIGKRTSSQSGAHVNRARVVAVLTTHAQYFDFACARIARMVVDNR